jgi:hypothetical protein
MTYVNSAPPAKSAVAVTDGHLSIVRRSVGRTALAVPQPSGI